MQLGVFGQDSAKLLRFKERPACGALCFCSLRCLRLASFPFHISHLNSRTDSPLRERKRHQFADSQRQPLLTPSRHQSGAVDLQLTEIQLSSAQPKGRQMLSRSVDLRVATSPPTLRSQCPDRGPGANTQHVATVRLSGNNRLVYGAGQGHRAQGVCGYEFAHVPDHARHSRYAQYGRRCRHSG